MRKSKVKPGFTRTPGTNDPPGWNEDRTCWLDREGQPPVTENGEKDFPFPYHGALLKPFAQRLYSSETGELVSVSVFGKGSRLPLAPGWLDILTKVKESVELDLDKRRKPDADALEFLGYFSTDGASKVLLARASGSYEAPAEPITRKRKRDYDLTPEQLAKRNKRRDKREARKRARS